MAGAHQRLPQVRAIEKAHADHAIPVLSPVSLHSTS